MSLKTTYTDSGYAQKEYRMTQQSSGYVTLEDVTVYSPEGDYYGCEDLNKQNYEYNRISNDFSNIQSLISKLSSYGVTVTNSPEAIVNAITSLASDKYDVGKSSGESYVQSHATSFGLRTTSEYNALRTKVQRAYNAMAAAISYNNPYSPISGGFSDPITSSEANAFKSSANAAINATRTPFITYKGTAISNINTAVSELTV